MKHIDELQIAGTALLLCGAMFAVSAVAPEGNTISKAVTNFIEAPETAAEAQAQAEAEAKDAGFPIYTQESNYDYYEEYTYTEPIATDTPAVSEDDIQQDYSDWETSDWESQQQPDNGNDSSSSENNWQDTTVLPDDIAPEDDPTQVIYPSDDTPSDNLEGSDDGWVVFPEDSFSEDYGNTDEIYSE